LGIRLSDIITCNKICTVIEYTRPEMIESIQPIMALCWESGGEGQRNEKGVEARLHCNRICTSRRGI